MESAMTKGAERAAGIPQTLDDQQVKRLKEKAAGGAEELAGMDSGI